MFFEWIHGVNIVRVMYKTDEDIQKEVKYGYNRNSSRIEHRSSSRNSFYIDYKKHIHIRKIG